ncbi:hypothetical protein LEN26_017363 [Aphanomyces euteiches]|nr:hypothetical protein LEN26_017363 [Aphanomyces euteiches]KAH9108718.1 hypothetical protein AeMF1_016124 [Aphanomyces euteiches]KAH9189175.1 hypothetical protein AeNC1_008855 [Aphanomyces euteiches]
MLKRRLALTLLVTAASMVAAEVNATESLNAETQPVLTNVSIRDMICGYFMVVDDDTTVSAVSKYIMTVLVGLAGLFTGFAGYSSIQDISSFGRFGTGSIFCCTLVATLFPQLHAAARLAFWFGGICASVVRQRDVKIDVLALGAGGGMAAALQLASAMNSIHIFPLVFLIAFGVGSCLLVHYSTKTAVIYASASFGAFLVVLAVIVFVGRGADNLYSTIGWGVLSVIMALVQDYYTALGVERSVDEEGSKELLPLVVKS